MNTPLSFEFATTVADRLFLHLRSVADKKHRLNNPIRKPLRTPNPDEAIYFDEILFLKTPQGGKLLAIALGRGRKLLRSEVRIEPNGESRFVFIPLSNDSAYLSDFFRTEVLETETRNGKTYPKISKKTLKSGKRKELSYLIDTGEGTLSLDFEPDEILSFSGNGVLEKSAKSLNERVSKREFGKDTTRLNSAEFITEEVIKVIIAPEEDRPGK
jgi:hypothetical protein